MGERRVLIFSATFGAGHLKAAEALIQVIREKSPGSVIIHVDFGEYISKTLNKLLKDTYIKAIKHTPKLYGMFYSRTSKISIDSPLQRVLNIIGRKEFLDYIHEHNPDVIISTYPVMARVLGELRLKRAIAAPVVSVVTDYRVHSQYIQPGVDLYIGATQEVFKDLVAGGIAPEKIRITGIPVDPKFERELERSELIKKLQIKDIQPTILVMAGAYGVLGGSKNICKFLLDCEEKLQVLVVCGRDEKLYQNLEGLEGRNAMKCYGFVDNVEELMSVSDLMITKAGGLTVSEALTKKLPMLIFKAIPGQEEENAHFLAHIGAAKLADTEEEMEETIKYLLSHPEEIASMLQAAAKALPGNAAEKAVQEILALIT